MDKLRFVSCEYFGEKWSHYEQVQMYKHGQLMWWLFIPWKTETGNHQSAEITTECDQTVK